MPSRRSLKAYNGMDFFPDPVGFFHVCFYHLISVTNCIAKTAKNLGKLIIPQCISLIRFTMSKVPLNRKPPPSQTWPGDALKVLAVGLLRDLDFDSENTRQSIIDTCRYFHQSVSTLSDRCASGKNYTAFSHAL